MLLLVRPIIRDLAGDILYTFGLTKPRKGLKKYPLSIVTFHRVLPEHQLKEYPINGIAVLPEELKWFVDLFKRDYLCDTLSHNYARWRNGEETTKPLMSITFDDGQLDNYLHARPILNKAKVPATFYAVSDGVEFNEILWYDRIAYSITRLSCDNPQMLQSCLDQIGLTIADTDQETANKVLARAKMLKTNERLEWVALFEREVDSGTRPAWDGMMNWKQLRQLIKDGHEVGCHSKSHPILPLCNETELEDEIVISRQVLEEKLGISINSFCYPNGDCDARAIKSLDNAGYETAVTTRWGKNTAVDSPFTLNRFDIQSETSRSRNGVLSASRLAWRLSPFFPKRV